MNLFVSPLFALWIAVVRIWTKSILVSILLLVSLLWQLARKVVTLLLFSQLLSSNVTSDVISTLSLLFVIDL